MQGENKNDYECDCGKILGDVNPRGIETLKIGIHHTYREKPGIIKELEKKLESGHLLRVTKRTLCKYCFNIGESIFCNNPDMIQLYLTNPSVINNHNKAIEQRLNEPLTPILVSLPKR
jgi:hypothetical protein